MVVLSPREDEVVIYECALSAGCWIFVAAAPVGFGWELRFWRIIGEDGKARQLYLNGEHRDDPREAFLIPNAGLDQLDVQVSQLASIAGAGVERVEFEDADPRVLHDVQSFVALYRVVADPAMYKDLPEGWEPLSDEGPLGEEAI